ncbi:hypothetical protein AB3S75_034808 [Citrus x aurantiifolia]
MSRIDIGSLLLFFYLGIFELLLPMLFKLELLLLSSSSSAETVLQGVDDARKTANLLPHLQLKGHAGSAQDAVNIISS